MIPKEITHASEKGRRDYQEDRFFVSRNAYGILLAVFDGHGGNRASDYCEQTFARIFIKGMDEINDSRQTLKNTFAILAHRLKAYYEGTTASVVFLPTEGTTIYTAVLGDSPIIVGAKVDNKDLYGHWYGPDHNIRSNAKEASAAEMRGGFLNSGYVFRSLSGSGLQMGRALGDSELGKVISNEPEIDELTNVRAGDYILVATDGLFDPSHHNFRDAAKTILDKIEQGEPAEGLVKVAIEAETGDNVTCILARI